MSGAEHQAALATLAPFADLGLQANCNPLQSLFPSGLRVLAVDDDPVCLTVVEQMLRKCSYLVTTAPNGTTALQLLRDRAAEFDLVLSDVYMPDMDGFKLLEIIGLEMDLPVIMMSSNGETNQVLRGVTHGACDFLIKPVRIEELRNMWQHVVRRKRLQGGTGDLDSDEQSQEKEEDVSRKRKDYCGNSLGLVSGSGFQLETQRDEDGNAAKKPRVVWSVEMHQQFVNAVNQLGIDKAVPKKILEIMNVDGLTRENVASHLQKYRLYLKRVAGVQPSAPSKSKPAGAAANTSAAAASQPAAAPTAAGSVTAATAASPGAPAGATPHASQPGSGTPAVPSLPAGPSTAGLTQQGSQQLPQLQPGAPTSNGLHTSAAQQPLDAANLGNAAAFPNPLLANPMAAVMGGAGLNPLLGLQGLGALGPMMNPLGLPTMQAPIGLLPGLTGSMPGPGGQGLMPMGLPGLAPMPGMLAGMPGMPFMQGLNPMAGLGQMQGVAVAGGVNMPGTMAMQQQMAANAGANGIGAFGMPATGMAPAAATTAGLQQPTLQVGAQQAQTLQQQPQAQQQLQPAQPQQQQQQPADPATSFTLLSEVDFCVGPGPLQAVPAASDGLLGVDNNSDLAAVFNDLYNGGGPSTVALVGDGPLDQKADDDFFNFLLKN